ncbi:MAG: hypothetical protein ACI85I_000439 [Arenicella sp.]|jgi:hypothetical protein
MFLEFYECVLISTRFSEIGGACLAKQTWEIRLRAFEDFINLHRFSTGKIQQKKPLVETSGN